MEFQPINVTKWIEENKADFLPPVCNKLMHNDQLKVMFVGGPNQRKDYHIEEGEELFYQLEGDMCLKIIENGEHIDIHIREGEDKFMANVLRTKVLRFVCGKSDRVYQASSWYYVGNSTEVLFERWFYCEDLGKQLAPVIDEFFNSKQYKTGKPDPDWTPQLPFPISTVKVMEPFSFQCWLDKHRSEIIQKKYLQLFAGDHETEAAMYGSGEIKHDASDTDTWIWQLEGSSVIFLGDKVVPLSNGDSLLIPEKTQSCNLLGLLGAKDLTKVSASAHQLLAALDGRFQFNQQVVLQVNSEIEGSIVKVFLEERRGVHRFLRLPGSCSM